MPPRLIINISTDARGLSWQPDESCMTAL